MERPLVHPPPFSSSFSCFRSHSSSYLLLIQVGPRLKPLQQIHARFIVSGTAHFRSILTKLATFSCSAGSAEYTRLIFHSVSNPDSFLFNTLIRLTSKYHKFSVNSLYFYRCMTLSCVQRSDYTFTSVIKACANVSALNHGRTIHGHVTCNGYGLEPHVQAALVTFYSKCGDLDCAKKVFDAIPSKSVVAWNSIISGLEQNGHASEAIRLFKLMRNSGIEPDNATFVSVLSACAEIGDLGLGCWVHSFVSDNGLELNVKIGTALIQMYVRCGNVKKAKEVFDCMKHKNVVSWTAMISGFGVNGHGREALNLFHKMKTSECVPNGITFIATLSACAHAGLVEDGRQVFTSMKNDFQMVPTMEHYVCYVDLLGRAGHLDEAYNFILNEIPEKPVPAIWTAMLGACKMHKNHKLGAQVAEHLLVSEPENSSHYVTVSNVFASTRNMDKVEAVRNIMIRKRLKKQVGYSTIEVDNIVHLFSMGDKSHAETAAIYNYLDELMARCGEAGYTSVSETVLHELQEEDTEYALRYHSEKLAIAFGLLKTRPGTVIRVVKNFRMCEDCHLAIKYISTISKREIVVRDKLRFHHFKDGSCSCLDFW